MDARKRRGNHAEDAAREHLLRAGLRDLARNASYRTGELDLVMLESSKDDDTVVFVEVRYRKQHAFGGGAGSVDITKRRKLVRAAEQFLLAHPNLARLPCRFDVIEAEGDPDALRLNWIRDAFRADDA